MKYQAGEVLYYVNPFVFDIEAVRIDMGYKEDDGMIYYIDHTGAYLHEFDLFRKLTEAQDYALELLEKFYNKRQKEIFFNKPEFREEL